MSNDAGKLPPGGRWFPLIGETLSFLGSPFDFIDRHVSAHGPIFRTHLLGKSTVILAGGETAAVFADEKTCLRDGSMPDHVRELFGGRSLPLLDGLEHVTRKRQVLAALVPETFAGYLPEMQAVIEEALSEAAGKGPIDGIATFKRLAISIIAKNILGMEKGDDLEKLLSSYQVLLAGFTGLPIPLPGTAYRRALSARDAILEVLRRAVAEHANEGGEPRTDGLARILAHEDERGAKIGHDGAAMELHHVFIAGYIVYALFASLLVELDRNPELRTALRAEVKEHAPSGTLTLKQIGAMRRLGRVVQEAKRHTPVVPLSFGRARTTFEVGGYTIPEGTMLFWAPYAHNQDPDVYASPRVFDPDRYDEARAEHGKHAFAFAPQGMGPPTGHKCAGFDYSTLMLQVFAAIVLRDYSYSLPEQDLTLNLAMIPPEPRSHLQIAFEKGAAAQEGEARPSQRKLVRPSELPPLVQEDPLGLDALLALAEIAWADGRMAKEEAEALVQIARSLGLDENEVAMVERATRERPGPSQGQALALGAEESEHLFTLACLVAAADGDVDPREHAAIAGLGDRLRLDASARERAATAARAVGGAVRESSVLRVVAKELENASLP